MSKFKIEVGQVWKENDQDDDYVLVCKKKVEDGIDWFRLDESGIPVYVQAAHIYEFFALYRHADGSLAGQDDSENKTRHHGPLASLGIALDTIVGLEAEIDRRGAAMEELFEHVSRFALEHYDVARFFDDQGKVK